MNLCDRCGRTVDAKQKEVPFKSPTDEVVFIQSQVRRVEQDIERLTAQRVHLQRRLNAIAASTVTLPYEIISTIFQQACPPLDVNCTQESTESSSKDGGITYPTLPFKLAAVCSQWRDIALSTPQLWTSVAFTLYQNRAPLNAAALETFFARSGSCEVAVSLIFASGDEGRDRLENDTPPSQDVLRVFVDYSKRWGTLKIDGLPPEWIPALRAAKHCTPGIRQLWLCPYDNSREQQMVDIFADAPELRRVTLDNTFLSAITLPWTGLTHLKVSWVSIDECAEMLRRCPSLLECDFSRILSNAEFHVLPQPGEEPPIVLKDLHTLKWSYAGDAWEFPLFERIRFPALRHLKMKLRYDLTHFQTIQGILGRMLGETSVGVERMDLDLGCPWTSVYEILRGVPKVKELRLVDEHDPEFVRGLIGALVPTSLMVSEEKKEKEGVFLPELRSLEFQGNNPTDFSFPKLVRRRARLENVNLELTSEVYVDGLAAQGGIVKDGLKELLKYGMKVRIVNGFDGKTWL
ncbi:hypothetical protein P691DRAFT_668795 [Macrolepiota fuliginosa MF-IS2]|uniref:F-box domain-containing protein n=1 Tax=Macrolepiota fuliginosa MF-IS2 TaxID=1400762 RepID=A0A9P6C525_9AGAR|nr:hypothetical protein P691DRAFT_668795 [Macrolepiota fuliginosa MF-IS2]